MQNQEQYLPFKTLRPITKPHIVLVQEAVKEQTLAKLQEKMLEAFDSVVPQLGSH